MLRKVLLPAPLLPHSAWTDPGRNASRPERSAGTPAKLLDTPSALIRSASNFLSRRRPFSSDSPGGMLLVAKTFVKHD